MYTTPFTRILEMTGHLVARLNLDMFMRKRACMCVRVRMYVYVCMPSYMMDVPTPNLVYGPMH